MPESLSVLTIILVDEEVSVLKSELLKVEKPARYMGGELGTKKKERTDIRFILAFPDVYEVGMSHLGLQILYGILNSVSWVAAERVYAPWPDMEELLRRNGTPLTALESDLPLRDADIIGFTLQYELSYTNILNMLELAGIPLLAQERGEEFPLVVGGGPCAGNPEPLADFFDAFLLGDGEEAVLEIAELCREWKRTGGTRKELLRRLADEQNIFWVDFGQQFLLGRPRSLGGLDFAAQVAGRSSKQISAGSELPNG